MKTTVSYRLDPEDGNWRTRLEEAFRTLQEFAPELTKEPQPEMRERLAYNRIVLNGEFTHEDLVILGAYVARIVERVTEVPNPTLLLHEQCDNLMVSIDEFEAWVKSNRGYVG